MDDGEQLLQNLKARGLKNKTCNKILMIFKQTLLYAELRGWILKYPMRGLPSLKAEPGRIDYLSTDEISQLLKSNADSDIYGMLVVGLNTGMRIGEICGLWWDRVHFQTNQIEVSRTYERCELQETTKTNLQRFVPMTDEVRRVLLELKEQSNSTEYVFIRKNGMPYNSDHFSKRHLLPAIKKANIRKVTFHVFRHTFASQFMMHGGGIYDLQKILGHTDLKMTQKYAHLSKEHLQAMTKIMNFHGRTEMNSPSIAL